MEKSYLEKIQIHKENKLAGLHPGAKLWVVILYTVCTFILNSIHLTEIGLSLAVIPWFLVVLILCATSGAMKKCVKAFKAVAFIAAISLSFMVMDIAGIFVWYFQTTSNKEIARALEESGMNYKAVYVFTSSLSMIDILSGNSKTIMNAQKARGVETEGNIIVRAKAFFPTLVPLILGAVIGSEERVLTLEARGFSMQCEKTHMFNLEKSGLESTVKIASVVVTILVIAGRVALWIL